MEAYLNEAEWKKSVGGIGTGKLIIVLVARDGRILYTKNWEEVLEKFIRHSVTIGKILKNREKGPLECHPFTFTVPLHKTRYRICIFVALWELCVYFVFHSKITLLQSWV